MKYFAKYITKLLYLLLCIITFHSTQAAVYPKDQTLIINDNETESSIENISVQEDKSRETEEESKDSIESTTISHHSSADASAEIGVDSIIDSSDFVETLPEFENFTERMYQSYNYSDRSLKNNLLKGEVEIINMQKTEKSVEDFHDEIKKRDVVKKVLKDIFENPIENIQTDLTADGKKVADVSEEQNIVEPNAIIYNVNSSKIDV